jgi:two-component system nitrogen regulation response regulator NtrX
LTADGAFREDLFFRLNVMPIDLPPLRERPDDIPALIRHFTAMHRVRTGQRTPEWSDEAIDAMVRHRWPGNIRELANIVERLGILHAGGLIGRDEVSAVIPLSPPGPDSQPPLPGSARLDMPLADALDEYERLLIVRALSGASGNIAEAARRLHTDRPNLYRRMRRLGLDAPND